MNVHHPAEPEPIAAAASGGGAARRADLLADAAAAFAPVAQELAELDGALEALIEAGARSAAGPARKLRRKLRRAEPSVTMVGQVKSGKTSLVNAMLGAPGLLPADVNPWTSVVTTAHLSPEPPQDAAQAVFRFFEADQWERLTQRGGRIGELAGRAGANEEMAQVARQLAEMQEKSRRRLGERFELLMGQSHAYGHVDADLIRRYVCLGDDFGVGDGAEEAEDQGRYADITRSADLYLHRPGFPMGLAISDTPGVNDTFLMREQITLQAIRDSRACVVVLSAHQAMSAVDMALIRMIAAIPSRDVVIFVNRIDELAETGGSVDEIEQSVRETLAAHHGPAEAEILFGSAAWAEAALTGTLAGMDQASADALIAWAEAELGDLPCDETGALDARAVWELSGVPALYAALAERAARTVARETAERVARAGLNLASALGAAARAPVRPQIGPERDPAREIALPAEIDRLEEALMARLDAAFAELLPAFDARMDRAKAGFVDRAVAALLDHLEAGGDTEGWTYDPAGLRVLLRTAHTVFARRARAAEEEVCAAAAEEIAALYGRAFGAAARDVSIVPPAPEPAPAPVFLGETIALDLSSGWWSRWFSRRRGWRARADDLAALLDGECAHMAETLRRDHGAADLERARATLREFIAGQRRILLDLWMRDAPGPEELRGEMARSETAQAAARLAQARAIFTRHLHTDPQESRS